MDRLDRMSLAETRRSTPFRIRSTGRMLGMIGLLMLGVIIVRCESRRQSATSDDSEELHHGYRRSAVNGQDSSVDSDGLPTLPANCTAREAKRHYRYTSIRDDILRKLRLSAPPNMTGRRLPAIPHLSRIIEQMCRQKDALCPDGPEPSPPSATDDDDDDDDDFHATTVKVLLFPTSPGSGETPGTPDDVCLFRLHTPDIANSEIVRATFGVYIRRATRPDPSQTRATWILIYQLVNSGPSGTSLERNLSHTRRIFLNENDTGKWYHFNMLSQVKRWMADPTSNRGLIIQASDARGGPLAVMQPRNADEEPYKPYLELHISSSRQQPRSKRTTDLDCEDTSVERQCCRYPLVVDFDSFGWDWVIVPRRYSAYYCSGECPFLYMQTHMHTHVYQQQQQQNAISRPGSASGGPCCSPRRVSAISMLYYDEYMNIIYGRLPGMVVEQCGCA